MQKKFKHYKQPNTMDCGATCLRMIAKHYGVHISLERLNKIVETTREGINFEMLSHAADTIGFRTIGLQIDAVTLFGDAPLPCVVTWNHNHFVIVYKIKKDKVYIADPALDLLTYTKKQFIQNWIGNRATEMTKDGLVMLFEPTPKLYNTNYEEPIKQDFKHIFKYLTIHKKFLFQLVIGVIAGSVLNLVFPFLTQSIVDIGIRNHDLNYIYLILLAQIFLFLGKVSIDILRGWILLHLSTRINISLVSDFFIKLMNLPISYFDTKVTGDILERVGDHKRIENLLTNSPLSIFLAFVNIVVFGIVLGLYSFKILSIYTIGSIFYFAWIYVFIKKRRIIDMRQFKLIGEEKTKIIELINGMQEIKLLNAEKEKRWGWEFIKVRLFKLEIKKLSLEQLLNIGSLVINELKNIIIIYIASKLVIQGDITLGMMLSIMYIIGQLNGPLKEILKISYSVQDAKISIERLNEIHKLNSEYEEKESSAELFDTGGDINIHNLSFSYPGRTINVLKSINLTIPANKTTAIVGSSGSGKTTLIKLLLKFYDPKDGYISLHNLNLKNVSQKRWRKNLSVVMQEGYIFNDSIAHNITLGQGSIDKKRLLQAVEVANIKEFIEKLPQTYNTKIGNDGVGISGGEKQRILIARAVYKNPTLMFFDEATSALDANNEKKITENLNIFFKNKTVVIIAHRLSTVKNADQIVVLENGEVVEIGNHDDLSKTKGKYYSLVKNQLELGI